MSKFIFCVGASLFILSGLSSLLMDADDAKQKMMIHTHGLVNGIGIMVIVAGGKIVFAGKKSN